MQISIIGAGRVGSTLGGRWATEGSHAVAWAVRDPDDPRHGHLREVGTVGTTTDVTQTADVVLLAVPWSAAEEVARSLAGSTAVIVDATNPRATGRHEGPSGAELVAGWSGSARVTKAFNTTGSANMADTDYPGGQPMMPVAGDDAAAKDIVVELAEELGFDAFDAGPLAAASDLEHLAALWIRLAYPLGGGPDMAFARLRR